MNKDLLVEIFIPMQGDEGIIATGYPVAPGRILTAGHVLDDVTDDTAIEVRWYNQKGSSREWHTINGVAWQGGQELDAALFDCAFPDGIYPGGSLSARRPRDDMRWVSESFLKAGKRADCREPISLQGRVNSKASRSPWFELGVDDYPGKPEDFKGASGSPVFVKGSIIGIIQSCPQNFEGRRLRATPVWCLLEDEGFRQAIGQDTCEFKQVQRDLQKRLCEVHDMLEALGEALDISSEGTQQEWAGDIVRTLLNLPCQEVIGILDRIHRTYCRDDLRDNADICIQIVNRILPATYDLQAVTDAVEAIQQGQVVLVNLPVANHTCAEIIMAGVDRYRATEFEIPKDTLSFPFGKLKLPDPPETGMDPDGKGFQHAWEDFIIEKFSSADDWKQFHSDQTLTRRNVIAKAARELAYQTEYLKRTVYYVFRHPLRESSLPCWCRALEHIKQSFPSLVFINLCEESHDPDEKAFVFHILRDMYLRHPKKE